MFRSRLLLTSLFVYVIALSLPPAQAQSDIAVKPFMVSITVSDLDKVARWYIQTLGFEPAGKVTPTEPKTIGKILRLNEFYLELLRKENACARNQVTIPEGSEICGYSRIGFRVSDFENFHQELRQKNIGSLSDIIISEYSGSTYFFLKDPDSNLVQIFPDGNPKPGVRIRPYMVGITVDNMEKEIEWYEQNLGFSFRQKWDVNESHLFVRLLMSSGLILELRKEQLIPIHRSELAMPDGKTELYGICRMAFSVDDLHSTAKLLSINKVQFLKELTYQDILGTTRHTIIVDPENNVVQLVE